MNRGFIGVACVAFAGLAFAHPLDNAWLKGTTDKDPLSYRPGEKMTFTLTPTDVGAGLPTDVWFLAWKLTDDFGRKEEGRVPFTGKPFVYTTSLDRAGFVRLEAQVVDRDGRPYENADKKKVFFDGGAGVDFETLRSDPEPDDFDEFWAGQYARLDKVPIRADLVPATNENPNVRYYAVRIDCAGLRPVTGYLSVPKGAESGRKYPARLVMAGYDGSRLTHEKCGVKDDEIILDINAHGLKLPEFGATEADRRALLWEIRSHDFGYAFDPQQNADREVAYFNGMLLRVKRALQYLKPLKEWDGKRLEAAGSSQGGLQTIWAAACGEGVTYAMPSIPWCCDMPMNDVRKAGKASSNGWYIKWTPAMAYYDAANFAKRIPTNCFTRVTRAGLGDYCCPPMGVSKMWNNIRGKKAIHWCQGSQHCHTPKPYEGRDSIHQRSK